MTTEHRIGDNATRRALEDGVRVIGVEFIASRQPLRIAVGIALRDHPEIVVDKLISILRCAPEDQVDEMLQTLLNG